MFVYFSANKRKKSSYYNWFRWKSSVECEKFIEFSLLSIHNFNSELAHYLSLSVLRLTVTMAANNVTSTTDDIIIISLISIKHTTLLYFTFFCEISIASFVFYHYNVARNFIVIYTYVGAFIYFYVVKFST